MNYLKFLYFFSMNYIEVIAVQFLIVESNLNEEDK